MNLSEFARKELELAGCFDKDADYGGMLGDSVMELVDVLAKQGHSGNSAQITLSLFLRVANYKPLTELTNREDEWRDVSEFSGRKMWQSTRCPDAFSMDGGKHHYHLSAPEHIIVTKAFIDPLAER